MYYLLILILQTIFLSFLIQAAVVWPYFVLIRSKNHLVRLNEKGGKPRVGEWKRREDNIREWTGLEFGKSQRAAEKLEKTGCEVIWGVVGTLVVKRLMMMMIRVHIVLRQWVM